MPHPHNIHFLFDEVSGEIIGYVSPESGEEFAGTLGTATQIPFTEEVPLRYTRADMGIHYMNGQPLNFTANIVGAHRGNLTSVGIVSDGINIPTFTGILESSWSDGYVNGGSLAAGVLNALYIWFDGLKVNYAWTHEASPTLVPNPFIDLIAPAFMSAQVRNDSPDIVRVTMNEALFGALPAASAFTVSGSRFVLSATSGGVGLINLAVDTPYAFGDAITMSYVKPLGNPLRDAAGNETASFGPVSVVNHIQPEGGEDIFAFDSTLLRFDTTQHTFDEARP